MLLRKLHWKNFLVSFLVDARGGAMRGCRHSGVRVIVPPRCAPSPTRITCRYVRPQRTPHPPPLMEGEALASRVLELGPVGAKFLGPVIIEVPHFAALRGKEREIVILRSDNGETWREHTIDASDDILNEVLNDSFEAEDLSQLEDVSSGRITRVVTHDFPQYFAIVTRIRQEVHAIGPEGGMVSSTVVPQVQAVFPQGALTKKIKVGLQAQPIDPELTAKLLGHGVAVSPVVTVEPRRRKFHKAITLSMPAPRAHSQGMINQYSGNAPTLRLLCSITGGTTRAQWEDVTGSTPLTFVNDCVSFTTTVSARFWLMDCRNIGDATKMATELYKEAIHVPFMAKFVVFAKRIDPLEARLRVFCMTDDKEDKTLEHQEHFTEVAKSRDVEVLEGKPQYIEFAGNLVPITKSGEPLQFSFRAFRENRLPFSVRVKDQHAEAVGRCLFMREPKVAKGEPPQQPICILNIVLPDDIVTETVALTDNEILKRHMFLKDNFEYYRPDPRLADMSNLLGEDWVPLATQLGLTPSEINVIKSEYPDSVAKQAQSMLRMWISQSGNKAQGDALENALMRIGREDIIPQCLNVDDVERIPIQRYHKDIDIVLDTPPVKQKETYESKYSAEEKAVEEPSDEEDFNKSVSERRQQIEKRLTERTIPASAQRQEIAEEITSIKRQSIVEDKLAEAEVKHKPEQTKTTTIIKTVTTDAPDSKKTVAETVETTKTTTTSDYQPTEVTVTKQFMEEEQPDRKTTVRTIITETRTTEHIPSNEIPLQADIRTDRRDSDLLEGVTQRLETTKKTVPRISAIDATASPQDDDDSLDTDGFREDQYLLETPTPSEDADNAAAQYLEGYQRDRLYGNLESQDVTQYDDIRDYYKHQIKLLAGDRKRLASTEDLDSEYLAPTPDRLTGIVKVGPDEYKVIETDPTRPGELKLTKISPEEKGVKDSKRPEDWERKEARKVQRLQGGAGKDKTSAESTEQRTSVTFKDQSGDIVVEKVTDLRTVEKDFGETEKYKTESIKITGMVEKGDEGKRIKFVKEESDLRTCIPNKMASSVEQRIQRLNLRLEKSTVTTVLKADKNLDSPIDDSLSHHASDTGISITRGTTDTLSSMKMMPGATLGLQTTGFASDIANDVEQEEGELTDASLSPIQADELPPIMDSETHFTEMGTKAATLTDQIDTKDASSSPIRMKVPMTVSETSKIEIEDVLDKRRGSGDFEEEGFLRGSTETLAQLDDTFEQLEISEKISKDMDSDADDRAISESLKSKERTHLTPKHVGPKIAELQKIFSKSSELEDSDDDSISKKITKATKFGVDVKPPVSVETKTKIAEPVLDIVTDVPVSEPEIEVEYKTVKEAKQMFESLISKSVETQTLKKSKTPPLIEKVTEAYVEAIPPKEPRKRDILEKPITEAEIHRRLSAVEDQIELESHMTGKEKTIERLAKSLDKPPLPPPEVPTGDIATETKLYPKTVSDYEDKTEMEILELNGDIEDEASTDSSIIKEVLISNTKLVSVIALPAELKETITESLLKDIKHAEEKENQIESLSEKELTDITDISRDRTIEDLTEEIIVKPKEMKQRPTEFKIEDFKHEIISSSDVRKVISEVLEASRQIKADIKEIKPDLTPTPEGQLITMLPSASAQELKDVQLIKEHVEMSPKKDKETLVVDTNKLKDQDTKEDRLLQTTLKLDEKIIKTFVPTFQINEIDKRTVKPIELAKKHHDAAFAKITLSKPERDKSTEVLQAKPDETLETKIRGKFEKLQKAESQAIKRPDKKTDDTRYKMKEKFEQQRAVFETISKPEDTLIYKKDRHSTAEKLVKRKDEATYSSQPSPELHKLKRTIKLTDTKHPTKLLQQTEIEAPDLQKLSPTKVVDVTEITETIETVEKEDEKRLRNRNHT
ncbi:ankyrin repeat and protein kinase domain-containing protein [Holotrichia oblita]|uniref:Ankyrin repeat and protein kinase domain-containing protein n=1 Tax=Holotrichia oblita TaxID=644536 RepID=A0ACB9TSD3_HOLOL|nr:ankyrin repeat and protein kinase domain-containing protein [Holotrichia oblita]